METGATGSTAAIVSTVPEAVRSVARAIGLGEIGQKLLTDPRMKTVWGTLRTQAKAAQDEGKLASRLAALHPMQRMETWGASNHGVALPDQACAAFLCFVVSELGVPTEAVKRRDMLKRAGQWRSGAEFCREATANLIPQLNNSELARALELVGKYFDGQAQLVIGAANQKNPYLLKRSSRQRNDDTTRARVRALAMGTRAIFGTFLYGTLVTVAAVALQTKVTEKGVINWCSDLPPPIKPSC